MNRIPHNDESEVKYQSWDHKRLVGKLFSPFKNDSFAIDRPFEGGLYKSEDTWLANTRNTTRILDGLSDTKVKEDENNREDENCLGKEGDHLFNVKEQEVHEIRLCGKRGGGK